MGDNQKDKALKKFQELSKSASWLVLKNVHLVTNWLPILAQNLFSIDLHENFR